MRARVSVVVPAHNAGRYLRPAVLSALEVEGCETVVVDDGSTDGSLESISDLPALVLRRRRGGEAAARNAGVRASSGGFVTFLDADDLLIPEGIGPRLRLLEDDPALLAAGGLPSALIDERGEVVGEVYARMRAGLSWPLSLTLDAYRRGGFFPVSCSLYLYRRAAFERAGFYDESLAAAPDCDFHYRLLSVAPIPVADVPTFSRRLHETNLSLSRAGAARPSFRPDVLEAIREVNRRHGMTPAEIYPWELDYL